MLWYNLLYFWGYLKQPLGSGLSIPFLIGAEIKFGVNSNYCTDDLLSAFKKMDCEYVIAIRDCHNIGELVCCLEEHTVEESKYFRKRFGSLVLISEYFNEVNSFSQLLQLIEEDYMPLINQGKYSVSAGKWEAFSKEDISIIEKFS